VLAEVRVLGADAGDVGGVLGGVGAEDGEVGVAQHDPGDVVVGGEVPGGEPDQPGDFVDPIALEAEGGEVVGGDVGAGVLVAAGRCGGVVDRVVVPGGEVHGDGIGHGDGGRERPDALEGGVEVGDAVVVAVRLAVAGEEPLERVLGGGAHAGVGQPPRPQLGLHGEPA
jgi:hypothetical protein